MKFDSAPGGTNLQNKFNHLDPTKEPSMIFEIAIPLFSLRPGVSDDLSMRANCGDKLSQLVGQ
jgi:hypothetical protein